jgi:hypothetical protein
LRRKHLASSIIIISVAIGIANIIIIIIMLIVTTGGVDMTAKTERITILGTPDFKRFLTREAKKEGVSLSQLVRLRCERKADDNEEKLLLATLLNEVKAATARARDSLEKGLADAEQVLAEIRGEA